MPRSAGSNPFGHTSNGDEELKKFDERRIRKAVQRLQAAVAELTVDIGGANPFTIDWERPIPHSDGTGVYLILDDEDRALYGGKSQAALGNRFWYHLTKGSDGQPAWLWGSDHRPRRGLVIPLLNDQSILAPALETLLIEAFDPPWNVRGRRRDGAESAGAE